MENFCDAFNAFIIASKLSLTHIAERSGLKYDKLERWKNGEITRPQSWGDIIRVAAAMRLAVSETETLLDLARHPSLTECQRLLNDTKAKIRDRELIALLISAILAAEHIYQEKQNEGPPQELQPPPLPPRDKSLLPPEPKENFIARDIFSQLNAAIKPRAQIALFGMGGVGKSELVSKIAYELERNLRDRGEFPDRIVYFDVFRENYENIKGIFNHIAKVYQSPPEPTPRSAAQLALGGRQSIIIIDGLECLPARSWNRDNIKSLLDIRGDCAMLLISRDAHDVLEIRDNKFHVPALKPSEAIELFHKLASDCISDQKEVERICNLVGYLPLGIELLAYGLKEAKKKPSGVREYLRALEEKLFQILESQTNLERHKLSIIIDFQVSLLDLSAREILAFICNAKPAPLEKKEIVQWSGIDPTVVNNALDQLVVHRLLIDTEEGYKPYSPLIYYYAHQNLSSLIREDWLNRLADDVVSIVRDDIDKIRNNLRHYLPLTLEAIRYQVKYNLWEPLLELVEAIYEDIDVPWYQDTRKAVNRIKLEATQRRAQADPIWGKSQECQELYEKSYLKLVNDHVESGEYHKAIKECENGLKVVTNIELRQQLLKTLSTAHYANNEPAKAIESLKKQLYFQTEANKETGKNIRKKLFIGGTKNYYGRLSKLINSGYEHHIDGKIKDATAYYQKALPIVRRIKDKDSEALILTILGDIYYSLGNLKLSANYYSRSLEIAQEVDNKHNQVVCLNKLSVSYAAQGETNKALAYCDETHKIFDYLQNDTSLCEVLNSQGYLYCDKGEYQRAIECSQRAFQIAQETDNFQHQAKALHNLSRASYYQSQINDAFTYAQSAIEVARNAEDWQLTARAMNCLGNAHLGLKQFDEANTCYQEAIEISRDIKDLWLQCAINNNLGLLHVEQGLTKKSLSFFSKTRPMARRCKFNLIEAIALKNRGNAYDALSWSKRNTTAWKDAKEIFRRIESPLEVFVTEKAYSIAIG